MKWKNLQNRRIKKCFHWQDFCFCKFVNITHVALKNIYICPTLTKSGEEGNGTIYHATNRDRSIRIEFQVVSSAHAPINSRLHDFSKNCPNA
eukprot:UN05559